MSVLPQDETGKAELGYSYDFEMLETAVYVDDGAGGVKLWDGAISFSGDIEVDTDDLEQLVADSLANYKISNWDDAGDPAYVGYLDKDGNYFIERYTESTGTVEYSAGSSGYAAAWTNRAAESYNSFDTEF